MKKIGIVGDIGSGKSFVAKNFNLPIFDADKVVSKIYKTNLLCFKNLKKKFNKKISKFPIDKKEIISIILKKKTNIKIIGRIVHPYVQNELKKFLKKHKNKKLVILDIPLIIENNIEKSKVILIFVDSKKKDIISRLQKRINFNADIYRIMKENQLHPKIKMKKSNFIIKNNFKKKFVIKQIKLIKKTLI